jgi:hypothetical protein
MYECKRVENAPCSESAHKTIDPKLKRTTTMLEK